jgi:tetratricopeptide (TPR) repeat protein
MAAYGKTHNNGKKVCWLAGNNYIEAYKIGFQLFEEGKYRQAIEAYQKSLSLNPVGLSARFEICEAYIKLNDLTNAKGFI